MSLWIILTSKVINAQDTKLITGRIISEDLELIPGMKIHSMDSALLGSTDIDGYFKIEAPIETSELLLGAVGMEWTSIKIEDDCQNLEMVAMVHVIYDFITLKKENRKRRKRFKQLAKKHKGAHEQGIFKSGEPCVCYMFNEF